MAFNLGQLINDTINNFIGSVTGTKPSDNKQPKTTGNNYGTGQPSTGDTSGSGMSQKDRALNAARITAAARQGKTYKPSSITKASKESVSGTAKPKTYASKKVSVYPGGSTGWAISQPAAYQGVNPYPGGSSGTKLSNEDGDFTKAREWSANPGIRDEVWDSWKEPSYDKENEEGVNAGDAMTQQLIREAQENVREKNEMNELDAYDKYAEENGIEDSYWNFRGYQGDINDDDAVREFSERYANWIKWADDNYGLYSDYSDMDIADIVSAMIDWIQNFDMNSIMDVAANGVEGITQLLGTNGESAYNDLVRLVRDYGYRSDQKNHVGEDGDYLASLYGNNSDAYFIAQAQQLASDYLQSVVKTFEDQGGFASGAEFPMSLEDINNLSQATGNTYGIGGDYKYHKRGYDPGSYAAIWENDPKRQEQATQWGYGIDDWGVADALYKLGIGFRGQTQEA